MNKVNEKYRSLFEQPENVRYYIITGGRGSGKSYAVNLFLSYWTYSQYIKVLFTRYTLVSAHLSIIPEFKEKIEKINGEEHFSITKDEIVNSESNSSILFKGIKTSSGNQTANLKSLQGVNCWVLDEAEELDNEETFDKIDLSIRSLKANNIVIMVLNPTTKEHWIYKRFFENRGVTAGYNGINEDTCYIHTDYRDNISNLSDSFVRSVEQIKRTNSNKYNHQILGGWIDKAEGVIYDNWKYGKFESNALHGYGLDFGFSIDPTALVEVSINKKKKQIFVRLHTYKAGLTTSQISSELESCGNSMIVADSAEPRLIKELKDKGHNIKACKKGAGSITGGIDVIRNYELIVDNKSTDIGKELNNYVWHDKKSSTPIDDYNHTLDALRYICVDLLNKKKSYSYA